MSTALAPFIAGFSMFASLIGAIGAQNLFVLRKGVEKTHTGMIVLFCSLSDTILILAGVCLFGSAFTLSAAMSRGFSVLGAGFLFCNGLSALHQAFLQRDDVIRSSSGSTRRATILTLAGLTWLNPHVYLDTVFLIGTASLGYPSALKPFFAGGAIAASFAWFSALGYGARLLRPVFQTRSARRALDALTGCLLILFAELFARAGLGATFPGRG